MNYQVKSIVSFLFVLFTLNGHSQLVEPYNIIWDTQSNNSGESMPCGGGDIGLNVWAENGEIMFYMSRSGAFDENNLFPKFGRVRLKFNPNPFKDGVFRQELKLKEGLVEFEGSKKELSAKIKIWVDVFRPVIHVEASSTKPVTMEAVYESWRTNDLEWTTTSQMNASRGYVGAPVKAVVYSDSVGFENNNVLWYHRNRDYSLFDITVEQQGLDHVKDKLWNPLKDLTFGGKMSGSNMVNAGNVKGKYANTEFKGWKLASSRPTRHHHLQVYLHIDNTPDLNGWMAGLERIIVEATAAQKTAFGQTQDWWRVFWNRSYIVVNKDSANPASEVWQVGRNYQLFRYQLGCNAYGRYPTKFNGGLFTYDPSYVNEKLPFTPDHRNWGGGTHTAQNQRLVYFPMFRSGDFDMLEPQLNFYLQALSNAELRTEIYWGHKGASFTEQVEQFGLPVAFEYGWDRPDNFPKGVEYNHWLEYQWDTQFEFGLMILDLEKYNKADITKYIPFIESGLTFFNEHYQYQSKLRSRSVFDGNGHLILYPGSAAETYKMAYNPTSTIAALKTILIRMLELPENYLTEESCQKWEVMLKRMPPFAFRDMEGHKTISPAWTWSRINNQELPQLYPVFPWGMYGIGLPDLETAINTWKYGADRPNQKNHISWHQDAIFCARLGLTDEAAAITIKKLKDSERRFPTFWGPGHDWVPDHNWGGSGMIGLQEMLMQTPDQRIFLFPAWPKEWDVDFRLHAPGNTVVEGSLNDGMIVRLKVTPQSRADDVIVCPF